MLVGITAVAGAWAWRWGPARRVWGLGPVFAAFALFIGAAGISGSAASVWLGGGWIPEPDALVPGVLGTAHASLLVAILVLRRGAGAELGCTTAPPRWAWGAALAGVPLFLALSASWAWVVELLGWGFEPQHLLSILADAPWSDRAVVLGYGALGAPLVEELMFRGFLLPPLQRRAGDVGAIVAGGTLFGLVHMTDPFAVVPLVALGVGLSWLRLRTGSIWPGVVVHVANNTIALVVSLTAA